MLHGSVWTTLSVFSIIGLLHLLHRSLTGREEQIDFYIIPPVFTSVASNRMEKHLFQCSVRQSVWSGRSCEAMAFSGKQLPLFRSPDNLQAHLKRLQSDIQYADALSNGRLPNPRTASENNLKCLARCRIFLPLTAEPDTWTILFCNEAFRWCPPKSSLTDLSNLPVD